MQCLDKNNGCFLTFRAHVMEPDIFETFLNIFLPIITTKFPTFIYSIEKDDSPDRHLHLFFLHNEKETQKLKQKLYPKAVKDYFKSLDSHQTNMQNAFLIGRRNQDEETSFGFRMTIEDKMKAIAYCAKDICRRQKVSHISQEVITQSCKFYYATEKSKPTSKEGWTIINAKNFHVKLDDYASKNSMTVHDYELIPRMVHDNHTFQLSIHDREKYLAELRFSKRKYDVLNDEVLVFMEGSQIPHPQFHVLEEYCSYLKSKLNQHNIEYQDRPYYENCIN